MRRNNWKARNLCLCGNFNMTNVQEIFEHIVKDGQHPRAYSDTFILLEQIGHRLDMESRRLYHEGEEKGLRGQDITRYIEDNIDIANVLRSSSQLWDGGFVICGTTGSGEMFVFRDPWGIRPAFWYRDEEQIVVASERPVIQTTLFCDCDRVNELKPGQALIVNRRGEMRFEQILEPKEKMSCSFERIYFSRGSDAEIYNERKNLGRSLVAPILKAIDGDIDHTVFSFIPNTAEAAFYGMIEGFNDYLNSEKARSIVSLGNDATPEMIKEILSRRVRSEKVAWKDIKLRTFIAEGTTKNELAAHVYDITYGSLKPYSDNLVIIDDSIVRGTTLKESIIRILDRLCPKKIIIVSSSPQVRYPDYYGIDMSHMDEFIAFRAAIEMLKEQGNERLIKSVYAKCKAQQNLPKEEVVNYVREIYEPFSQEEISRKMAVMLRSKDVRAEVAIVYQTLEGLHEACPNHKGDWYFSGHYPTPGGNASKNWNQVGGPDGEIHVITREEGSGTLDAFKSIVLGKDTDIRSDAIVQSSTESVKQSVKQDENAIGFVSFAHMSDDVKALSVDKVNPSIETISDGSYELQRPFLFLVKGTPSKDLKDFIDWVNGEEGQKILSEEKIIRPSK